MSDGHRIDVAVSLPPGFTYETYTKIDVQGRRETSARIWYRPPHGALTKEDAHHAAEYIRFAHNEVMLALEKVANEVK